MYQSVETIRPLQGKILAPQMPGEAEAKATGEKIKAAMAKEGEMVPTGSPETRKAIGETINKMAEFAEEKPDEEPLF